MSQQHHLRNEPKIKELTTRIRTLSSEISMLSRVVIKVEWEKVKQGEKVYVKTKFAAKWAVIVSFLIIVVTIAGHAYVSKPSNSVIATTSERNRVETVPQQAVAKELPKN